MREIHNPQLKLDGAEIGNVFCNSDTRYEVIGFDARCNIIAKKVHRRTGRTMGDPIKFTYK